MASFPAEIQLTVNNSEALRSIGKVERALQKIQNTTLSPFERGQASKAEAKINKQLDVQAQKYAAVERIQRQLLANDNSRIKANEKLSKTQQFIQDKISQGRIRRASAAIRGDESQYPTTIGPQPNFEALERRYKKQQAATQQLAAAEERLAKTRADNAGLQKNFQKLQQAENKARLEAARSAAQAKGDQAAYNRVIQESTVRFKDAIGVAKQATKAENERQQAIKKTTNVNNAATKKSGGRNRLGSALVGGAFPALFGGGPGAILGGFAGELVGPLGGVVGSALGSQLDAVGASAIKLGQALDDVNPDVNRLISAIGLAGTETGKLIQSIERVEGAQVAQAIAAEQMAALVGTDGVQALKDAGDAATELGQEASRAFTALAVALAPALEAVSDFLAKNITEQRQLSRVDPGFLGFARGDLADRVSVQNVRQDFSSGAISEEEARKRLLDIVKEIEEVERRIFDQRLQSFRTLNDSYEQVRLSFELSQQELEVARLGGDLKNDAVYAAEQQNIKLQFAVQYQQLLNEAVQTEADRRIINLKLLALENKELAALANLENARNRALTSAAKSVARAPQSRELQLRQQILRVEQDLLSLQIEGIRFAEGEAASLVEANVAMQERLDREVKIIELQREQALAQNKVAEDTELINQLYDKQLEKAKNTLGAEFDRNVERLRAIKLERELLKLSLAQEENQVSTGLNRSIEDVQRRIDSPFGGDAAEMLELQIEQTRRYTDALEPLEEQLKQIEARRNSTNDKTILENLRLEEESVNNRIQAYKNLLPVLDQVEQQELQLQQTLQKIQPITDALANGFSEMVRGLIDGTQSVEEAFANMLKNMGNALIQEGTRMIAQYIAIGIARAFATGTSPSLPGGGGFGQNSPQLFTGGNIFDAPFKRFEGGGYTGNAPRSGGLDGRGGFMAMMHPQETVIDHRSAMNRYPSGGNQIPTFNLETTVINGVEYATVDQVRAMGKQAAREGASGGHARSMTTLKNSRSQRSKLGMR